MEKLKLTLAVVLSSIASGSVVYLNDKGETQQIEVVDAPDGTVEITGGVRDELLAEFVNAQTTGKVDCATGRLSNAPSACYCTDEANAGWITAAGECPTDVSILEGKLYGKVK